MSEFALDIFLITAMAVSAIATLLIRFGIITQINTRQSLHSQVSFLDRDFLKVFRLHRQHFPNSHLRVFQIATLLLAVAFTLAFTFAQSLGNSNQ